MRTLTEVAEPARATDDPATTVTLGGSAGEPGATAPREAGSSRQGGWGRTTTGAAARRVTEVAEPVRATDDPATTVTLGGSAGEPGATAPRAAGSSRQGGWGRTTTGAAARRVTEVAEPVRAPRSHAC